MSLRDGNAAIQVVDSRIIGATIFSECSHVTRRATLGLERGLRRVAFRGLPPGIDPADVRVSTTRGSVRAIETDELDRELDHTADTTALTRAIDALRAKAQRIGGELEALNLELTLIDRVVPAGVPTPEALIGGDASISLAPLRPEIFLAGLDTLTRRRRDTIARIRALELERLETDRQWQDAARRRDLIGVTGGSNRKESVLLVSLDVSETGDCALDLTYEAAWATWRPYYHVRLDGKENTVECVRFADVWQETGEDWIDCRLRLSTAEPEAGLRVPNVLPWSLGVAKSYEDKLADLYSARRRQPKGGAKPEPEAKPRPAGPAGVPRAKIPPPPPPPPAAMMPMIAAQSAPMARGGGLLGGLFSGGGGSVPDGQSDEITGVDLLPPLADEFADYAKQFEEEGEFASVTATGMVAMRAEAMAIDGAGRMSAEAGAAPFAPPFEPPPPMGPGGPADARRPRRGPSPNHPDYARLVDSKLPRDSSGGINYEMEIGAPTSCLSGKERQRLGLGSISYPARIEYLLRPAVTDHAFGRVTVVNSESVPMLSGPAAIFVGDGFFGETEIKTTPAGGKLVLDLGAETAIKCARRSKTTVRTEGILSKEDVHVVEVTIDIENHTGRIVELEVQDQVPLSKDSKVKVHLDRTNPKDAQLDELTGILTFKVRAAPGAKMELSIVYQIEAPQDYQFRQMLKT